MYKRILCFLCLLLLLCTPLWVSASNEAGFSLSDIETNKNRIFETTLSVTGCPLAAVTATLTYDSSVIEFREAKSLDSNALLSVNSQTDGTVKIAYLNENGTEGGLVVFRFKSHSTNTFIDLEINQAITADSDDISVSKAKGANVSINVTAKDTKPSDKTVTAINSSSEYSTEATQTQATNTDTETKLVIRGEKNNSAKVIAIAVGCLVLTAIVVLSFYLGRKSSKK